MNKKLSIFLSILLSLVLCFGTLISCGDEEFSPSQSETKSESSSESSSTGEEYSKNDYESVLNCESSSESNSTSEKYSEYDHDPVSSFESHSEESKESDSNGEQPISYYEMIYVVNDYYYFPPTDKRLFTNYEELIAGIESGVIDESFEVSVFDDNYVYLITTHFPIDLDVVGFYDFRHVNKSSYVKVDVEQQKTGMDSYGISSNLTCYIVVPKSLFPDDVNDITNELHVYVNFDDYDQDKSIFDSIY